MKDIKLPKGQYVPVIVKKEVDDEHYYYVDDKFTPSVTKILHETLPTPYALRKWIGDLGTEKAETRFKQAGERGTAIHDACEALLYGQEIKLKERFPKRNDQKCIISFMNWVNEAQPVVKKIELIVASKLGFAGTLDIYCEIEGKPWIIDIKTSSGIYDSHRLQIIAYKQAFKEMTGIDANVGILHLNYRTKRGYSFIEKIEIGKNPVVVDDYMKVFEVYKMLNGGAVPEPPMIDSYPDTVNLYDESK